MNNALKIIMIVILCLIALGLGLFLFVLIKSDFKFNGNFFGFFGGESHTLIEEKSFNKVEDIFVNSNVADVYIEYSDNNEYRVELYSDNVKDHSIKIDNNDLKISLEEKNWTFFNKTPRIILYVPIDYSNTFDITNTTGDLKAYAYEKATFKVNVTTGDVDIDKADKMDINTRTGDINNNIVNDIKVVCTTGDIRLGNVNNSLDLKTTTGDIRIDSIDLKENSNIQTTTGDVRIESKNDIYVDASSKTGDINIDGNNRYSELTLTIKVTTGDIKVG